MQASTGPTKTEGPADTASALTAYGPQHCEHCRTQCKERQVLLHNVDLLLDRTSTHKNRPDGDVDETESSSIARSVDPFT